MGLIHQATYYYNYKLNIKPTFLKMFDMLGGHIAPVQLGLYDKLVIYKLAKLTQILFKLVDKPVKYMPVFGPIVALGSYIPNCTLLDTIMYGIPHSILYYLLGYHTMGFNVSLMVHYSLICYYLKYK